MKKVFIIVLTVFFSMSIEPGYAFQALKTFASGFSCLTSGKTRDQVEWEALFNATQQARENVMSQVGSMSRMYSTANVDIIRTVSETWEKNDMGQECFISRIEAAVMPKGEVTIAQREIRMRGLTRGVSKEPLPVEIRANDNINPGDDGKPLPSVAIHIYQLKNTNSFKKASLKKLFMSSESVLGSSLIDKEDLTIEPGSTEKINIEKSSGTKYIGLAAFYKDYKKDPPPKWKQAVSVTPSRGYEIDGINVQLTDVKINAHVKRSKVEEPAAEPSLDIISPPEKKPIIPPSGKKPIIPQPQPPAKPVCYTSKQTGDIQIRTERFDYYEGDRITLFVKAKRDLYALIVYKDVAGNEIMILPNEFRKDNFFRKDIEYTIPRSLDNFYIEVNEPFGLEHIYVYASTSPIIGSDIQKTPLPSGYYKMTNFSTSRDNSRMIRSITLKPKDISGDLSTCYPESFRSISIKQKQGSYKTINYDCKVPVVEYFQSEICVQTHEKWKKTY